MESIHLIANGVSTCFVQNTGVEIFLDGKR